MSDNDRKWIRWNPQAGTFLKWNDQVPGFIVEGTFLGLGATSGEGQPIEGPLPEPLRLDLARIWASIFVELWQEAKTGAQSNRALTRRRSGPRGVTTAPLERSGKPTRAKALRNRANVRT